MVMLMAMVRLVSMALLKDVTTGAVHIGENSLITIEENGVQKLYAKDVNELAIDIDITEGQTYSLVGYQLWIVSVIIQLP